MGDFAQLEAQEGDLFAVDIIGVILRGHVVRVERPRLTWSTASRSPSRGDQRPATEGGVELRASSRKARVAGPKVA